MATGVPIAVVPYDPFRSADDLSTYARLADLPWVSIENHGAIDGEDCTGAFVDAHAALGSGGGTIIMPPGEFLVDPDEFTVSTTGVQLVGAGWGNTVIRRGTDVAGDLITVTGHSFTARDFSLMDVDWTSTNEGTSLLLSNINDVELSRIWFQKGYELLRLHLGSNVGMAQCIFEGGRRYGARVYQTFDVRLNGNTFYTNGVVGYDATGAAQLKVEKDAAYTFRPHALKVVGNTFYNSNIGHHIFLSELHGASIVGNSFDLAGRFNPDTYDDIHLESCERVVISGNNASAEYNGYIVGNRASRYNVYADSGCEKIVIGENGFNPGMSGKYSVGCQDALGVWLDLPTTGVFSASGGTWTVASGDIGAFKYKISSDDTVELQWNLRTTTLSLDSASLLVDLPAYLQPAREAFGTSTNYDGTGWQVGTARIATSATQQLVLNLTDDAGTTFWPAGTDTIYARGQIRYQRTAQ